LDEIAALVEAAAAVEQLRPLYYQVNTIARNHAGDPAAMEASARLMSRIVERGNELCRASLVPVKNWREAAPPEGPLVESPGTVASDAAAAMAEPAPVPDTLALIPVESRPPEIPRPVIDIKVDRSTMVNGERTVNRRRRPPAWLLALAGTLMGISMVVGLIRIFVPQEIPVQNTRAEAAPAAPAALPYLQVQSDLESGHVLIDGKLAGPLENGEFRLRDLPAGDYLVSIVGGVHQADYEFRVATDGMPQFRSAPASPSFFAFGFAAAGGKSLLVVSKAGGRVSLDDAAGVPLPVSGATLAALGAGEHQLDFADASGTRRFQWKLGSSPAVHLFVRASDASGSILALPGEDGAEVLLNGKAVPGKSADGRLRIPRIAPGEYRLSARKPGFQPSPQRTVVVRRGQDSRVSLPLRPL
jgi:hypothetical protein